MSNCIGASGNAFFRVRKHYVDNHKPFMMVIIETRCEELMWFQRSRTVWLADGDQNTKYYRTKTLGRRKRYRIIMLKDESGNWIDSPERLQIHVIEFYKKLFAKPASWMFKG